MSFREELKSWMSNKIEDVMEDFECDLTFRVTNDYSLYLSDSDHYKLKDKECLLIMSYGNEARTRYTNDFYYFNGSISIMAVVPINQKEKFVEAFDSLATSLSIQSLPSTVEGDYVTWNLNSCSVDGNIKVINGEKYVIIMCIGTYSRTDFEKIESGKLDKVLINGSELKYIVSATSHRTVNSDTQAIIGKRFALDTPIYETDSFSVTFIYNPNDSVHQYIKKVGGCYLDSYGKVYSAYCNVKRTSMDDGTKNATTGVVKMRMEVSIPFEVGNFTMISVNFVR